MNIKLKEEAEENIDAKYPRAVVRLYRVLIRIKSKSFLKLFGFGLFCFTPIDKGRKITKGETKFSILQNDQSAHFSFFFSLFLANNIPFGYNG